MVTATYSRLISRAMLLNVCHLPNMLQQQRYLLPKLPSFLGVGARAGTKTLKYSERRIIGYSMDQMYLVVSDVDKYDQFVPWCTHSSVHQRHCADNQLDCRLSVGFPPIDETYSSVVTLDRPRLVRSESFDTRLFSQLLTTWCFSPGPKDDSSTCILEFTVSFQFRSSLYSRLAQLFLSEVVHKMVGAFLKRAELLNGPPSVGHSQRQVLHQGPVR